MLEIRDISVRYGRRFILQDFSLPSVTGGQLVALLGPNAAGKSTLLKSLAGLLPMQGSFKLDGMELTGRSIAQRSRMVAFMPQAIPAIAELTVLECTMIAAKAAHGMHDHGAATPEAAAMAVLTRLDLTHLALQNASRLSGGQRQLVSLAQAIVRHPRLLLLDEPTSALDIRHQAEVMIRLKELAAENRIVVAVLHDLSLAMRYADQIAVLSEGRLQSFGPAHQAITPAILADVYGVSARVEACSQGQLHVMVDQPLRQI